MKISYSIVLITSAGSTLGNALAKHFISLGAKVVLCDSDEEKLQQTYLNCKQHSEHVCQFHIKSNQKDTINQLFDTAKQHFNRMPNVLVNNWRSTPMPMVTSHLSADPFIEQLTLMATNLFSFSQASSIRMRQEYQRGVIVNVISHPESGNLSGAENATSIISGFTHTWAKELDEFNIRVGAVVPEIRHLNDTESESNWTHINDELIRSTEYIITNDFFNGRVVTAQV